MPDEAIFDLLRPQIRKQLSASDRRLFDKILFTFPDTANFLHVETIKLKSGKRIVEISKGFLLLNQSLSFGMLQAVVLKPKRSFSSYLSFIASQSGQAFLRYENGGPLPIFPSYGEWAGIPKAKTAAIATKYRDKLIDDYTATLLFAVFHETAHHINGDVDHLGAPDSESRDQEYKADIFALTKVRALGYSPSSVAPFLMLMMVEEGDIDEISGSHDPSVCRLANVGTMLSGPTVSTSDPAQELFRQILIRCNR